VEGWQAKCFLVYVDMLVAASPAETSKETPEGQLTVAGGTCVKRVQLQNSFHPYFAGGSSTVDASWVWDIVAWLEVTVSGERSSREP